MVISVLLVAFLIPAQSAQATSAACVPTGVDSASLQLCRGEEEAKLGDGAPAGTAERTRHFEAAVEQFRRAADVATLEVKITALKGLADVYDTPRLNDPGQREVVLRELIALVPTD